jgi:hypothetical protein
MPAEANTEDRLASALRENLFRRKAQARARATSDKADNDETNSIVSDDSKSFDSKPDMKG